MKYIKLFEAFTNQNYKEIVRGGETLSTRRANGSINWFTASEIEDIRNKAKEIGIPHIAERSKGAIKSFFGDTSGKGGLKESLMNFYRGGNLCNEVNLDTKSGLYNIIKSDGDFVLNGKNTGKQISAVLNMMIR